MTIQLGRITPVNQREGYSDTIDPSGFVNAFRGTIQAGQQLQNFASKGFDMVVAEKRVYDSTQTDLLNIERKTKMNAFLNNTRNGGNPQYLEQDYNTAYKQINKDIIKKAPNDRIRTLVEAEGQSYLASNLPSIQKEARVYRLNGLKTGVITTLRGLRGEMIRTDDPVLKQDNAESIKTVLSNAVAGGIMLPSEASDELLTIVKDNEAAFIRRKMNAAGTMDEFDKALATTQHMKDETKEMRRDQFRTRLRERRSLKLAEEARNFKISKRNRVQAEKEAGAFVIVAAGKGEITKATLDDMYEENQITKADYNQAVTDLHNPPESAVETDGDVYQGILDDINAEGGPAITAAGIFKLRSFLEDTHLNKLLSALDEVENGTVDPRVTEGWKILAKSIGTPASLTRAGTLGLRKQVLVFNREFIDRYQAGENPIEVANDISNRWQESNDVTSAISQNRTARSLNRIPAKYRMSSKTDTLDVIPDTFGMKQKINDDSTLSSKEYITLMDEVKNIQETWSIELQEKHGGTKKADTIAAEIKRLADEAALKKQQAEDLAAQKAEEERLAQLEEERKQAEIQYKKEMEAREVVQQQEREQLASKKQKAEVDKQMRQSLSQVSEIAKSLNIDPDRLVELIEPLFQEMGGLEVINQVLGQAAEERDTKQATKQAEVQKQDKKRVAKLTGQGQQATAQVEKEVARLGEATGKQERLAVASSEAKVLAKRAKEKQAGKERQAQKEKQREKNLAEQAKTGLEDKKKYPDKKLLKRLSDLQFRNIDEKLSSIETKEMETIEKEIKNRKLTPLPLG
jgi:hypothetical protein